MRSTARSGMTLVELLVVITIIGILGGIVALVAPRFQESTRVAEGARQFTNWLEIARVRAQRDTAPRGLRISPDVLIPPTLPSSPQDAQFFYYKFSYVEQPDDITGIPSEIRPVPPVPFSPAATYTSQLNARRANFQTAAIAKVNTAINQANAMVPPDVVTINKLTPYVSGPAPRLNAPDAWKYFLWLEGRNLSGAVKAGDVVEFGGARYTLIVDPVTSADPSAGFFPQSDSFLVLHRQRDEFRDFQTTRNTMTSPLPPYRITRAPRPIAGEPELTLPSNVALDFILPANVNGPRRSWPTNPSSGPIGYFDIMFSPSGEVIGGVGANGRVIFWVRDVKLDSQNPAPLGYLPPGENRLVVLHCRNGQVTAHPVNPTLGTGGVLADPYSFVRDGKSSAAEDE
jgi:prepilin-type N-terminal cleavage/methylation domain-containing protein